MEMFKYRFVTGVILLLLVGAATTCNFQKEADAKFGDQNFKSSIALIELHRVRFGQYPATLSELKFTGEWDQIYLGGVEYKRLENGYELNVTRGWIGKPSLEYPPEFWNGLGLVRSNMKPSN
jgi:hypothetical protein